MEFIIMSIKLKKVAYAHKINFKLSYIRNNVSTGNVRLFVLRDCVPYVIIFMKV
jgi:hypothetical protein